MSGDAQKIHTLWEVKTGKREPENLDDVFAVQLGTFTEEFNREWFTKITLLPVIAVHDFRTSTQHAWMLCNLDGEVALDDGTGAVFEAKHTHAGHTIRSALAAYQPQLHHNMMVTKLRRAYLSVIMGNAWDWVQVDFDEDYAARLLNVEKEFWECVTLGMPPSGTPPVIKPPPATKTIDMTGNNEWASMAAEWLANEDASKAFDRAAKGLRELVPADAKSCAGHGVRIDRDKRRALRIRNESHEK